MEFRFFVQVVLVLMHTLEIYLQPLQNAVYKITLREIFKYRAKDYTLSFNGQTIERKAFLITVANAGQYGNDFYIAPQASMQDGLFHVAIIKPFNAIKVFGMMRRILSHKAYLSPSIETLTSNRVEIEREAEDWIHFDGEPAKAAKSVVFEMHPASLKVIVGEGFNLPEIIQK